MPDSGGGGLTDIGIRSLQGGVVEAVLLRLWGPLLVTVPSSARPTCTPTSLDGDLCTVCGKDELSLRWVIPDLNGTGELEIRCLTEEQITDATWFVTNLTNKQVKCVTPSDDGLLRVGIPASIGDDVRIDVFKGKNDVSDYASCKSTLSEETPSRLTIDTSGKGRVPKGAKNTVDGESCRSATCGTFQGHYFGDGAPLTAPAEGYGDIRQTPALRRFMQLAQAALDPGDPITFAPYYAIKPMTDPFGKRLPAHALLTLDTIGDMNVPLNSGIAFARAASGALPVLPARSGGEDSPVRELHATPEALLRCVPARTANRSPHRRSRHRGDRAARPLSGRSTMHLEQQPPARRILHRHQRGQDDGVLPEGLRPDEQEPRQLAGTTPSATRNPADKCVPIFIDPETCAEALFDNR